MQHITVLKTEAVDILDLKPDAIVVDATYGSGGHGELICSQLDDRGTYIGIDADETALQGSPLKSETIRPTVHLVHDNHANLDTILRSLHIEKVDGILADLGWRSEQFEAGGKGFSFRHDEPLLMTYGDPKSYLFNAHDIINHWQEEDIANVIYAYGEDRQSRRIAAAIVAARRNAPIATTLALAAIIESAIPRRFQSPRLHPATKTFQALRIAVNDELKVLETFITAGLTALAPGGTLAIISFHSLEDRIVKLRFREAAQAGTHQLLTKKPIEASLLELNDNPRARSAKLRAIRAS